MNVEWPPLSREATIPALPDVDNASSSLAALQSANLYYRSAAWPEPYTSTSHCLRSGDARDLSWIADKSVHLVVTSPPYWTLKEYAPEERQMGAIENYEKFIEELDKVWTECPRVLLPGGRVCCVVGDVCIPPKRGGRQVVMPLHAGIMTRSPK